jgi:transcription elongation factor Elf1
LIISALKNLFSRKKEECHFCDSNELVFVTFIRATCVNEFGIRYPDAWKVFQCKNCGVKFRQFLNGNIAQLSEEEWKNYKRMD